MCLCRNVNTVTLDRRDNIPGEPHMVPIFIVIGLIAAVLLLRVRHSLSTKSSRAAYVSAAWLHHYKHGGQCE